MYLMLSIGAAAISLCAPLGIATLARSPKDLEHLKSEEDQELKAELARLLDESEPGNPKDAEIWHAIRRRGVWHFIGQVRLQAGLYCEVSKLKCGSEARDRQVAESKNGALLATFNCLIESALNRIGVRAGHIQALVAAQAFRTLCIDVQETLGDASV